MLRIPMTPLLSRLAQVALVAAGCIAFAVAILPSGDGPSQYNDKLLHGLTFLLLGGLAIAAYRRRSSFGVIVVLTIFGGLIELAQLVTDWGRSAELADLGADMLGSMIGIVLARCITRKP